MTATQAARGFSRMLDLLENGSEEIVIVRNERAVARLVPGTVQMTALEALSDLYRTLPDVEGRNWLREVKRRDRKWKNESRDPWE
jgi:antitoxin (DNA-binding transcriptional repressor) of toxin-antitoxin stability system